MKYMGSKNKISKHIVPIIESYIQPGQLFVDLFVGGFNLVDKITKTDNIVCNDNNHYLISLFEKVYETNGQCLYEYDTISEKMYYDVRDNKEKYDAWIVGLVGFCATFGARFFEGYARGNKADGTPRDLPNEVIRNIRKQWEQYLSKMKPTIICFDYKDLNFKNAVIYCDKPYCNGKKYKNQTFSEEEFWNYVRELSKENTVIISEYDAPSDFECIWEMPIKTSLNRENSVTRTEKLFILKNDVQ